MDKMLLVVLALALISCGGAIPRVEHSTVDIQGHKCETTRTLLDTGKLRDSSFTYKCDPPLPQGMVLTAQGMVMPNPVVSLQFATMANAPFNPPDQECQMHEFVVDGQVGARVPVCVPVGTTRDMIVQPISR